ncbi:MAG: universal stress protein [Bacteroidales bacterium]|nr:universal stress protein [Bacteroidales bacterium]
MKDKINNIILVPTDFSEVCENATNQAAEAARFFKYELYLLHVIDKNTNAYLKNENLGIDSIYSRLQKIADGLTAEFGIEVKIKVEDGDIFTTISSVAQHLGAKLVYLGTHGKVGMQKLTGSFALKVITESPAPVIVVQKRKFDKGFRNILLPITSDAGPWEKTNWASFMAKQLNAKIHLFSIPGKAIEETTKTLTKYFEENKVEYTSTTVEKSANFSQQVIDHATSNNYDLIMIMTNPDTSWTKYLLGSYDEEIIFNQSQIPVMCINPRKYNWEKITKY